MSSVISGRQRWAWQLLILALVIVDGLLAYKGLVHRAQLNARRASDSGHGGPTFVADCGGFGGSGDEVRNLCTTSKFTLLFQVPARDTERHLSLWDTVRKSLPNAKFNMVGICEDSPCGFTAPAKVRSYPLLSQASVLAATVVARAAQRGEFALARGPVVIQRFKVPTSASEAEALPALLENFVP